MADRRNQSGTQAQASDTRQTHPQAQAKDERSLRQRERREPLPPQRKGTTMELTWTQTILMVIAIFLITGLLEQIPY